MSADLSFLMNSAESASDALHLHSVRSAVEEQAGFPRSGRASSVTPVRPVPFGAALRVDPYLRDPALPQHVLWKVFQYVNEKLDSRLTWEEIASAVGMDQFRLGRGFKQSAGMTLHQYVTRCRVWQAMQLLADDGLSIADVALEVGCSCQSHLTTLFRKHTGTTPGAFRRAVFRGARPPAFGEMFAAA